MVHKSCISFLPGFFVLTWSRNLHISWQHLIHKQTTACRVYINVYLVFQRLQTAKKIQKKTSKKNFINLRLLQEMYGKKPVWSKPWLSRLDLWFKTNCDHFVNFLNSQQWSVEFGGHNKACICFFSFSFAYSYAYLELFLSYIDCISSCN